MKSHEIHKWDIFWKNIPDNIFNDDMNDWYSSVWNVGREYWSDIFNKFSKGKKILECGAGSAKISLYMARQGYHCTMADKSFEALNVGKHRFNKEKLPGCFLVGDVTRLNFKNETFDIVTSGGLLHHFKDISPPIKEMVRVLKKDGLIAAVVIPNKFSCQTIGDIQHYLVRFMKNLFKGEVKHIFLESRSKFPFFVNSYSLKEYRQAFESAGVRLIGATGLCPFPSFALPKNGQVLYAKGMNLMLPLWKRFDRATSKFTEYWGASFGIYGIKK